MTFSLLNLGHPQILKRTTGWISALLPSFDTWLKPSMFLGKHQSTWTGSPRPRYLSRADRYLLSRWDEQRVTLTTFKPRWAGSAEKLWWGPWWNKARLYGLRLAGEDAVFVFQESNLGSPPGVGPFIFWWKIPSTFLFFCQGDPWIMTSHVFLWASWSSGWGCVDVCLV